MIILVPYKTRGCPQQLDKLSKHVCLFTAYLLHCIHVFGLSDLSFMKNALPFRLTHFLLEDTIIMTKMIMIVIIITRMITLIIRLIIMFSNDNNDINNNNNDTDNDNDRVIMIIVSILIKITVIIVVMIMMMRWRRGRMRRIILKSSVFFI